MTMFALALLLPIPQHPVIPAAAFPLAAQWKAVAACPVLTVDTPGSVFHGSGVVVGVRDGFAYVLTAAHVVKFEVPGVAFFTQGTYPRDGWRPDEAKLVKKWEGDIDLALVRFAVGANEPPVLPLAAPGQRPRVFPVPALTVGTARGTAPTVEADTILAKRLVRSGPNPDQVAFFWEMAQPSRPGRSGGPLLDSAGRVIGICTATQGGLGYYVHIDEIHAALKRDGGEFSWLIPDAAGPK
jgi:S1-C subfamily serine protease